MIENYGVLAGQQENMYLFLLDMNNARTQKVLGPVGTTSHGRNLSNHIRSIKWRSVSTGIVFLKKKVDKNSSVICSRGMSADRFPHLIPTLFIFDAVAALICSYWWPIVRECI